LPRRLGVELAAGAMTACVALPLCIAAGTLAYSSLGDAHAPAGAVAGIVSAIAGGFVASVARRSSFVATIPTSPTGVIQASILTGLLASFDGEASTAMICLTACVALAGILQAMVGVTGVARVVKLAPHPVIAGFVSGVGLLIVKSQVPMLLAVASFDELRATGPGAGVATRLPFGIALVAAIMLLARRAPRVPALLAGLLVGLAAFHGLHLVLPGLDLGPVIGAVSLDSWAPADVGEAARALWSADAAPWRLIVGGAITLALVGTLDTVFAVRAAHDLADVPIDQNRDLFGQGIANLTAAMAGGLFVSTSMSLSAANHQAGGRSRVSTLATALLLLTGAALFPVFVSSLPLLVLSAILVVVGLNVVDRSALRTGKRAIAAPDPASRADARRNAAIVLAVGVATFLGQPIAGAGVGVILACIVFMIEMNRPIVRRRATSTTRRSKRIRSGRQNDILAADGRRCVVLELQGVLFFGNADQLATELEERHQDAALVVLDFAHVSNVDASGAAALDQIASRMRRGGRTLLLSGLSAVERLRAEVPSLVAVRAFDDIDAALEHAERQILDGQPGAEAGEAELLLHETDLGRTMDLADLFALAEHMEHAEFPQGTILSRAGDPGDRLWVLTRGSVGIWADALEGRRRVASIGRGCVVGEMGLLDGAPRSADVCADEDVAAYVLTSAVFAAILENRPRMGQSVLASIARQLAERLRTTTDELRATMS
jgi:SulP family sulfate permease